MVACEKMSCLPQYHPDYLVQLLNLGKMRRIRAILRHLVSRMQLWYLFYFFDEKDKF